MDNVINLFGRPKHEVASQTKMEVEKTMSDAMEDIEELNIVNCMIVMIDDEDTITYSYANFNRKVTMVGAIENLKHLFMEADDE